jgi:hypothetical protein
MAMDIEETVAKLRKAKNEDDLFYKIREYEKRYIEEEESAEKGEYLFSIDAALAEENLNKGVISKESKSEFETKGFSLSENATIKKEIANKWEIINGKKIYIVRKKDGKLNIYGTDKEAIKNSFDNLMLFYQKALEIATLDVTRDGIAADIHLLVSRAFRKGIEIEPSFPLPVHPLESQELKSKPEEYPGRTRLGELGQSMQEIGATEILERSREKLGELGIEKTFSLSISQPVMAHLKRTIKGYRIESKDIYGTEHRGITREGRHFIEEGYISRDEEKNGEIIR